VSGNVFWEGTELHCGGADVWGGVEVWMNARDWWRAAAVVREQNIQQGKEEGDGGRERQSE
jgi:hypothetical protein